MRISIHQPQYIPWLPYLLKIASAECFIMLDTVDFQKNGLQNRNRVKTSQGVMWLTVPVKHHLGQKIKEVEINTQQDWRKKHWQTLLNNYRRAPFFKNYQEELENLYQKEWLHLASLNETYLMLLLKWFDIHVHIVKSSELNASGKASELILNLCQQQGATTYISGLGGKTYLDEDAFKKAGIQVVYVPSMLPKNYPQLYPQAGFINDLSVLDLLFNCGANWRNYLPLNSGN